MCVLFFAGRQRPQKAKRQNSQLLNRIQTLRFKFPRKNRWTEQLEHCPRCYPGTTWWQTISEIKICLNANICYKDNDKKGSGNNKKGSKKGTPGRNITCTVHYMYSTLHVLYITCTVHYMYSTLHVLYITCTVHYMYCTL